MMIDILCKDIVKELAINRIVETGTDKGETVAEVSRWLAEFYPVSIDGKSDSYKIYSVDIDEYSFQEAQKKFANSSNISLHQSSSEVFLKYLLGKEKGESNNYLFFLDANWGQYWPLRDEIKIIQSLNKYVIVIDDFYVPGKSDPAKPNGKFGFDIYKNTVLNWSYIYDLFKGNPVRIFYPKSPNRDGRGWVLLAYGYNYTELNFLKSLPFVEVQPWDKSHAEPLRAEWRSHLDPKNILKSVVPANVLRKLHRAYDRVIN